VLALSYTTKVRALIGIWLLSAITTTSSIAAAQTPRPAQTPPVPQTPATLGQPPAPASPAPAPAPAQVPGVPPPPPTATPPPPADIAATAPVVPEQPPFAEWLAGVRAEALARGIRAETVDRAFDGVEPVQRILDRDRAQAEFTLTTSQYLERRLTRDTLKIAKKSAAEHGPLLDRVHEKYGVPTRFLVSVWGLESNFGRFAGVRPMIPTLATLAYEPRRAAFFRQQLFDALQVVDRGYIELSRLNGSWAGAMGQPQFMPSSYLAYAQDFDGDGQRDIWDSHADVFASIAFYLQSRGWVEKQGWGRRVELTDAVRAAVAEQAPLRASGCRAERQMSVPRPIDVWKKLGVHRADKHPLSGDIDASLIQTDDGKDYLVYKNYEILLAYNCAHTYALSVSMLSDAIDGIAPLPTFRKAVSKKTAKPSKRTPAKRPARGKRSSGAAR
jgi:membrane-bound lytic murein transglycosylase B